MLACALLAIAAPVCAQRFVERARLRGSATAIDPSFGHAVAVDGDLVVVGAPEADLGRGAVFVFDVGGATPVMLARFSDLEANALGSSVAIRGSLVVAGAPRSTDEARANAGIVFVLSVSGATPPTVARIFRPGAPAGALFGSAVAITGADSIAVGAPGMREVTLWRSVTTPAPAMTSSFGMSAVSGFGGVLAAAPAPSDATTPILAIGSSDPAVSAGVTLWTPARGGAFVVANPGEAGFGSALALLGGFLAVGSPALDAVHVFSFDEVARSAVEIARAPGPAGSGTGTSVQLMNPAVLTGAPSAGATFGDVGEVLVMRADTIVPRHRAIRSTLPVVSQLGESLSYSAPLLVAGAPGETADVIVFEDLSAHGCTTDRECAVGEVCVDGTCCDDACGGGVSDCMTCASEEAPGWCTIAPAGTSCGAGGCGVCTGDDVACPACPDAGSNLRDAAVARDAGARDAAAPLDAGSRDSGSGAQLEISFSGGGGCVCSAAARRSKPSAIGLWLALALAWSVRRRARCSVRSPSR